MLKIFGILVCLNSTRGNIAVTSKLVCHRIILYIKDNHRIIHAKDNPIFLVKLFPFVALDVQHVMEV